VKLLLVEDISELGWLGDIVEVKDGYARNFLLPYGLAKEATDANIKAIADEKNKRAEQRLAGYKQMEAAAAAVDGAEAVIAARANEQGHLFGSVTEKAVAENLHAQGFMVAEKNVKLSEHIKQVGSYPVAIRFAEGIKVNVTVTVVAEGMEQGQDVSETQSTETQARENPNSQAEDDQGSISGPNNTDK